MKKSIAVLSLILIAGCSSSPDNDYNYIGNPDDPTISFLSNYSYETYFHINHSKSSKSYVGTFYGANGSGTDVIKDVKIPANEMITVHSKYAKRVYKAVEECGYVKAEFIAQPKKSYAAVMYEIKSTDTSLFFRKKDKCVLLIIDRKTNKPINITSKE